MMSGTCARDMAPCVVEKKERKHHFPANSALQKPFLRLWTAEVFILQEIILEQDFLFLWEAGVSEEEASGWG